VVLCLNHNRSIGGYWRCWCRCRKGQNYVLGLFGSQDFWKNVTGKDGKDSVGMFPIVVFGT
jgi:hypothetical protein